MYVFLQGGGGTLTLEGSDWTDVTYVIEAGRDLTIRSGASISVTAALLVQKCLQAFGQFTSVRRRL